MSKSYDNAFEFLNHAQEIIQDGFDEQVRKVQEDMSEGLREAVEGGWMTQDEADAYEYEWMQKWCPGQGYSD
jgi:hypothetical protein